MSLFKTCNEIQAKASQQQLINEKNEILNLKISMYILQYQMSEIDFIGYEKEELELYKLFMQIHKEILINIDSLESDLAKSLKTEFLIIEIIMPDDFSSITDLNQFLCQTLLKLRKIKMFLDENIINFESDLKIHYTIYAQISLIQDKLSQLVTKLRF